MPQKLVVGIFICFENTSQFSKDFLENYNEDSDEGCFLEVDVQYLDKLYELHNDLPFCLKECKLKKLKTKTCGPLAR